MSSRSEGKGTAARVRGPGMLVRLRGWRDLHLHGLLSSIGKLAQRPWATLLTIAVMALALALPLGLWLLLHNVERFSGSVAQSRDIGVFLRPQVAAAQAQRLAASLRARPDVQAVRINTPAQGLAEFRAMSDLAGALDVLDLNPLPYVLVVTPDAGASALPALLRALPEAEIVQHDAGWRERLNAWLAFGQRAVYVVALLLGLGALLVVGNTVRLDIQARAEEIAVLQLLGATDGFVRRPFLYLGACYGLGAGLLALLVLLAAGRALSAPLARLVASYGSEFSLSGPGWQGLAQFLMAALVLGWLGAWLAAGHHLRVTRPTRV